MPPKLNAERLATGRALCQCKIKSEEKGARQGAKTPRKDGRQIVKRQSDGIMRIASFNVGNT
jgi:hypothetical protein